MWNHIKNALKHLSIQTTSKSGLDLESIQYLTDALKVNSGITNLSIPYCGLGIRGAAMIADALKVGCMFHIQPLLMWNHIKTTLTELNISGNDLRHTGVRYIADALKINNNLTSLNISHNKIGEKGARALADALKVNTSLIFIFIYEEHTDYMTRRTEEEIEASIKMNGENYHRRHTLFFNILASLASLD